MKICFENVARDDFSKFLETFVPLRNEKIGLCFDTAHLFASGYKIEDLINKCTIMPDLFHLNGNATKFGSKTDIH